MAARTQALRRLIELQSALRAARQGAERPASAPAPSYLEQEVARLQDQVTHLTAELQTLRTRPPAVLKTVYRDGDGLITHVLDRPISDEDADQVETSQEAPA